MRGSRLQERELERLERNRYARRLGVVVEQCGAGSAVLLLPIRPQILNRGDMVHGGAIASALLSAAMLAAASSEQDPDAHRTRPLSVTVSFLEAVRDRDISVVGRVVRRGRSIVHATLQATAGASVVATGLSVYGIESGGGDPIDGYRAADARASASGNAPAIRMSGSPYGSAAGIEVVSEIAAQACLRMPAEPNAGQDGCVDAGAITGLIDNCGAFATYSHPGVSMEDRGATVAMSVAFCPPVVGPLRAVGRVVGRTASAFCSEVEVAGEGYGPVAATASVVYRIRPTRDDGPVRSRARGGGDGAS